MGRCMLSNALPESMNLINRAVFHSRHCSIIFCSLKIKSIHALPFQNPTCSCLKMLSIAASILVSRTLQNTLLEKDGRVIPLQMPFWRSPFFCSFTLTPYVQSAGYYLQFRWKQHTGEILECFSEMKTVNNSEALSITRGVFLMWLYS